MVAIIKLLFFALTASATPLAVVQRDKFNSVQNDIAQKIDPQITKLNNDVNGFPVSGLVGALAIENDVQALFLILEMATFNVKATGLFNSIFSITIVDQFQSITATLLDTLAAMSAQAPSWTIIPGGRALILSDLKSLATGFMIYLDAIVKEVYFAVRPDAISIRVKIIDALRVAIAAYSD
ncbi:hypothetical protein AA313_de0201647 [Arthrobotrys entomopaga]|nr:hypothetical protein AA313_de0201647 [Arthrobotrys entomopaga]